MLDASKALIVDDEESVRMALELALHEKGWVVEQAASAEKGLERFRPGAYAVIFVDKNLPGMNGVEFIRRVRASDQRVGIVMITGYASVESAAETLQIGIDAYLEKPFENIFEIVERAHQAIACRRSAGSVIATPGMKARAGKPPRTARIIVAVPSLQERMWLNDRIRKGGDEVVAVANAAEAFRELARAGGDLLIADAALQDMPVRELFAKVRMKAPNVIFIVVTEKPSLEELTRYIELGVKSMVQKPLTESVYAAKIEILLQLIRANVSRQVEG